MMAMQKNTADQRLEDTSALMRLHEFICGELAIPPRDVARRVKVAVSVSAAFYTMSDDGQIIDAVFKAMAA
jgi:hypothetical protein